MLKQQFDWSFASSYLVLVSLGYIVVGALGTFANYPPLPDVVASFLLVYPYALLHALTRCTSFFSCTLKDLAYDFAAAQPLGHLFVPVSAFLSCLGLLGLVSLLRRNQTGCFVVRALAGLSAFVAIGNWIAYALGITVYGSVSSVAFWIPTASVFWSLTYCLAASRIRADRTSAN
jgi:hypothetical protein